VSARADRKAEARKALGELLMNVSQLGKVLRARSRTTAPFEVPPSRSDQSLLTAARQFARDAALVEEDFTSHGLAPAHIAGVAASFEAAVRDRGMSRSEHTAARTRIRELLSSAFLDVRRLNMIIGHELAGQPVIQAVWKQARRIGEPRGARMATPSEQPAPTADAAAAPPQAA
jgi:hypothetical protein